MRGAVQKLKEARAAQYLMGTVVEIVAWGHDGRDTVQAVDRAMGEFGRLEKIFSRFDPASELSRVNGAPTDQAVLVSCEFFEIVAAGLAFSSQSLGCFSVTLLPLIQVWERCAAENRSPQPDELSAALDLCNPARVELEQSTQTIRLLRPGVGFDFGGFVKGHAVDQSAAVLKQWGVERAFINAGNSSIGAFGAGRQCDWRIGIRHPLDAGNLIGTVQIADGSLSSSGSYERPFYAGDRQCSHIIDPRSGLPSEHVIGATVLTDCAARAEVMSKMMVLLDCEEAFSRFDMLGWQSEGLSIASTYDGDLAVRRTAGLRHFQLS